MTASKSNPTKTKLKRYMLSIPCDMCEEKGRPTIACAILSKTNIPDEALQEFLAKYKGAIILCEKCGLERQRKGTHYRITDEDLK